MARSVRALSHRRPENGKPQPPAPQLRLGFFIKKAPRRSHIRCISPILRVEGGPTNRKAELQDNLGRSKTTGQAPGNERREPNRDTEEKK
jgi:hypothetical protein